MAVGKPGKLFYALRVIYRATIWLSAWTFNIPLIL